MTKDNNIEDITEKEVKKWRLAAWTLPFTALAFLLLFNWLGWSEWYDKAIVLIAVTFFSISVFWWWWALHKVSYLAKLLLAAQMKFEEVRQEFKNIKRDITK
jgi:MFS superfamily sulfate permease-like transporter